MGHRSSGCLPAEKFPTFASGRLGRGPATLLSFRSLFPLTPGNLSFSIDFDEYLSLVRSGRRIWEELQKQWVITSDSIVQLPKHLPKNRPLGVLEYNVPKAAIVFEVFFGAVAAGRFLCEPVGKVKVGW
jgi:hypothetical protein